ncbi:protein of unknown function DUF1555 [Rippkaea orientalis PCC 8801]|uniref:Ice-binding protein C-terminal domain-containing protein n=1 Tax=Rippkaea orientalis (strain PCC 8801 / RF-1) TaxID=41431 RepID=B7JUC5_RIPO1|nr:PEP-CTERM sorting domain-containing protein [Rippkaea orientalis]ACK64505.1 protein of unknown function DUF1555 [Rippkaea orientalis PCC 8801]
MLTTNKLTKTFASGTITLGVLAGLGLASTPAQAGIFTFNDQFVEDSEWGAGTPEPIWSTFPDGTGDDPGTAEGCLHNLTQCVNGYDNPLITHTGGGKFKIEYFGSGNAALTNDFLWDLNGDGVIASNETVFGPHNGSNDGCSGSGSFAQPCDGNSLSATPTFTNPVYVDAVDGVLPFTFVANGLNIDNGDTYVDGNPHFFATIDGTWATTSGGPVLYLGLSDRGGNDDDAADYVIRITQVKVPEPGTILGLLAVGGLGFISKKRKQK